MRRYISDGTWFKEGTECKLIDDYGNGTGLFEGLRICEIPEAEGGAPLGSERIDDQEVCQMSEFKIEEI